MLESGDAGWDHYSGLHPRAASGVGPRAGAAGIARWHPTSAYNVGLGHGYSTKQVVETVQLVTDTRFETSEGTARQGEPAEKCASTQLIQRELGWKPKHDLESNGEERLDVAFQAPAGVRRLNSDVMTLSPK